MRNATLPEEDFQVLYAAHGELIIQRCIAAGTTPEAFAQLVKDAQEHNAIFARVVYTEIPLTPTTT